MSLSLSLLLYIYIILDLEGEVHSILVLWTSDLQECKGNVFFLIRQDKQHFLVKIGKIGILSNLVKSLAHKHFGLVANPLTKSYG